MNDIIKEIQLKDNHILQIIQDDNNVESPREWDNLGTMLCCHRDYSLGDKQPGNHLECLQIIADDLNINTIINDLDLFEEVYNNEEELKNWIDKVENTVILSLYLYEHSGISISTRPFSCRWDSGQIGYMYCTPEKIKSEFNDLTPEILKKVKYILQEEVKIYDMYLTGDITGFKLIKESICDKNCKHQNEIDSCWGFYGDDYKTNGILDCIDKNLIDLNSL